MNPNPKLLTILLLAFVAALSVQIGAGVEAVNTTSIIMNNGTTTNFTNVNSYLINVSTYNNTWLYFNGINSTEYVYDRVIGILNNSETFLNTPTYDGSNQTVHPSIVYFETAWNGYKYWMAMTPYPGTNDNFENPSILSSNDGQIWVVPVGLTNPINSTFSRPSAHYNDPDLIYNNDTNVLEIYWLDAGDGKTSLFYSNSSDGITWTNQLNVLNVSDYEIISPAIIYKNNVYTMWVVNSTSIGCSSTTKKLQFYNSTDGISWNGSFSTSFTNPSGKYLWHMDIDWIIERNEYWMIFDAAASCNAQIQGIFLSNSSDGITWTTSGSPLITYIPSTWDEVLYRPTFLYNKTSNDMLEIWYSASNWPRTIWHTGYTSNNFSNIEDYIFPGTKQTNEGTICIWINNTNVERITGYAGTRNSKYDSNWIQLATAQANKGYAYFGCMNSTTEVFTKSVDHALSNNTWFNLCGTYNSSGLYVYKNGVLLNTTQTNECKYKIDITSNIRVGTYYDASSGRTLNGSADELRVYNRSLYVNELLDIFNSGRTANSSLNSTRLVIWKRYDEGSKTTSYDFSGNNINGTINDATWQNDGILNLLPNVSYSFSNLFNFTLLDNFYDKVAGYFTFKDNTFCIQYTMTQGIKTKCYDTAGNLIDDSVPVQITSSSTTSIKFNSTQNYTGIRLQVVLSGDYTGRDARYVGLFSSNVAIPSANITFNGTDTIFDLHNIDIGASSNSNEIAFEPAITIQSPFNQTYNTNSIGFNITVDKNISWAGYSLDGAANVTMQNDTTLHYYAQNTSMKSGTHSVTYWANDSAGNMNSTNVTFTIENTRPTISAYSLSGTDLVQGETTELQVNASDNANVSSVVFTLKYPAGTQFNYTMALLNGTSVSGLWNYTISTDVCAADYFTIPYIYATDSAGNVQVNATTLSFQILCPYQVVSSTSSGTGTTTTNQTINQSANASIQNNITQTNIPVNITIKGGIQNITKPLILVNPDKIILDAAKDSWIKATVELKNVDNITHTLTLSSSNSYFMYSEIYDIPMSTITLAPNETKNVIVSVYVKTNDTIVFNVLENNVAVGRFYVYPTVKGAPLEGILAKINEKLSYSLELSKDAPARLSLTDGLAKVKSIINLTIPYFGAILFVVFVGILSILTKLLFPSLYDTHKTTYIGFVLVIAAFVLMV